MYKIISAAIGAGVGATLFKVIGGIGIVAMGSGIGLGLGTFVAVGAIIGTIFI